MINPFLMKEKKTLYMAGLGFQHLIATSAAALTFIDCHNSPLVYTVTNMVGLSE